MQIIMLFGQVEAFADTGEHAEGEDVDLEKTEDINIVFVPFDTGAVFHSGIHDGAEIREFVLRDDEASGMLSELTGKAHELGGEFEDLDEMFVVWVETLFFEPLLVI